MEKVIELSRKVADQIAGLMPTQTPYGTPFYSHWPKNFVPLAQTVPYRGLYLIGWCKFQTGGGFTGNVKIFCIYGDSTNSPLMLLSTPHPNARLVNSSDKFEVMFPGQPTKFPMQLPNRESLIRFASNVKAGMEANLSEFLDQITEKEKQLWIEKGHSEALTMEAERERLKAIEDAGIKADNNMVSIFNEALGVPELPIAVAAKPAIAPKPTEAVVANKPAAALQKAISQAITACDEALEDDKDEDDEEEDE